MKAGKRSTNEPGADKIAGQRCESQKFLVGSQGNVCFTTNYQHAY